MVIWRGRIRSGSSGQLFGMVSAWNRIIPLFRRDPKRVNSIEERPKHRLVAEDEAGYLNHQLDIEEQLGIVVGSDGEFRNHVDDVSRIFIMQKDADGSDLMMDLKSAEIERESLEFWLQV